MRGSAATAVAATDVAEVPSGATEVGASSPALLLAGTASTASRGTASSAAAIAAPSAKRAPGSFASARSTTSASSAGTEAGSGGGGSLRWRTAISTAESPGNGGRPASISYSTTPTA